MINKPSFFIFFFILLVTFTGCKRQIIASKSEIKVEYRKEVSQYGITWTFEEPAKTGQFITGDWWVIGPVKIVKITPAPGPAEYDSTSIALNRWGDTSLKLDMSMRNGSMVVLEVGTRQGYDSRNLTYRENASVILPLDLAPNRSLISSISNTKVPVDHFCKNIMWPSEKESRVTLKTAAVLTCLEEVPPADAFRPPYGGKDKPIFRARDIKWDVLPKLEPAGEVPSWEEFERYFQRPWIDHLMSWEQQELVPNENGPPYGREHARVVSIASLMVMLDVPRERKAKLTIGLIQRGIDLYGLAMVGGSWNEGGGHSSGRKWPILFASIMLDNQSIAALPETAFFQEDTQTYYGNGWFGQNVLWQMIRHHGIRETYEEKPPEQWEKWDRVSESYRTCCNAMAWVGTTLAARYLKAIELWGHDAYFDYTDRWMREDDPYAAARGSHPRPRVETTTFDPFVTEMWRAYRQKAPEQEMAGNNRKFVWEGNKPKWIQIAGQQAEVIETVSTGSNREILINGKPYFPIMSWAQPVKNYSMLKGLGINTFVGNSDPVAAKKVGGYSIPGFKPDVVENGYIMAWIFDDEPDMPSGRGAEAQPRQAPEKVAEKCSLIKAANPDRLIFMTFTGHFTREQSTYTDEVRQAIYPEYIKSADVPGFDIYPIYGSGYPSRLDWVSKGVTQLCELSGDKPVYAWIETSKGSRWMTYEKQPDVLPIHTRNEVWQAITHGATAIGYFTHAWKPVFVEFAPTSEMQEELLRLNAQISRLSQAILAPPARTHITMNLGHGLDCHFKATNYNGYLYVFALNMDLGEGAKNAKQFDPIFPREGRAVFTVEGLKAGTKIEVIDENRTILAEDGKFSDDFAPLREHVYKIKL